MDRRNLLAVGGVFAAAALAGKADAQTMAITGKVEFEGGGPIPEGELRVFIEGDDQPAARRGASAITRTVDDKATSVDFSLDPPPTARMAGGNISVVATVQRADGWLLARGSEQVTPGTPVTITLHTVMY